MDEIALLHFDDSMLVFSWCNCYLFLLNQYQHRMTVWTKTKGKRQDQRTSILMQTNNLILQLFYAFEMQKDSTDQFDTETSGFT